MGSENLGLIHLQINVVEADKVDEYKVNPNGNQEGVEERMVADSDAVVKPLAVVIEAIDALVAYVAVSRLLGPQNFTSWTDVAWVEVLVQP